MPLLFLSDMSRLSLLAALLFSLPAASQPVASQDDPSRAPAPAAASPQGFVLAATPVQPGDIQLDGQLDEGAWAGAPVATDFTQLRPNAGEPASEKTEARVLYDGKSVYVGMRMHDTQAERINTQLGRRDSGFESDWALVAFDSYDDDRTAFGFQVSASGVQADFLFFDDVNEDDSWDAVWDVATSRDSEGWTAEFRIPLSQLRFASSDGAQTWGVDFSRRHFRTNEQSFWAPLDPNENGVVSQFGELTQLNGLQAPRSLEIQPYIATSVTRAPDVTSQEGAVTDPYYRATDAAPRVGVDVKYGLTSDLTLTATVNPDFGQVEADPAQVNLGGFELSFNERRPFFIEGAEAFNMEPRRFFSMSTPSLLYTRRIGRAPQRSSFVPSAAREAAGDNGVVYTDAPQNSTILGAAKLSGRIGRFSVGVLNATTAAEHGRFQAFADGRDLVADDRALVEPLTNYFVGRTRATFGKTIVGGLATSVIRDTGDPSIAALLPRQSTVAGLDVEHPIGGGWMMNAQLAGSVTSGSETSIAALQTAFPRIYQRPDADHLAVDDTRTSLSGLTAEANLLKTSGDHWVGSLHTTLVTPGFDANALGFQSRADQASVGGVVVYQENQAKAPFQRWSANVFGGSAWNLGGDRTSLFAGGNMNARFTNFWGANANWNLRPRNASDRLTRGGPIGTSPAGWFLGGNVSSDDRKAVSGYAFVGGSGDELGSWQVFPEVGVEIRPSSSLTLSLGPDLSVGTEARQFVTSRQDPVAAATFGRRYVFAELDATTLSLTSRVNWTFTPDLSLQLYARPYVTRGRYSNFQNFDRPGALALPVFGRDQGTATEGTALNPDGTTRRVTTIDPGDGGDPFTLSRDFVLRSLQGNAVLRWQYRPGSTLFFVWQQQRDGYLDDGSLEFDRDVRGLFRDPLQNVFLIKLSYWLG